MDTTWKSRAIGYTNIAAALVEISVVIFRGVLIAKENLAEDALAGGQVDALWDGVVFPIIGAFATCIYAIFGLALAVASLCLLRGKHLGEAGACMCAGLVSLLVHIFFMLGTQA